MRISSSGPSQILPDVRAFLERLCDGSLAGYRGFFDGDGPVFIARAPGRLDVMGGIADYSGATVCELPIAEAAIVGWQWREDDLLRVRTLAAHDDMANEISLSTSELFEGDTPVSYAAARERLTPSKARAWAAYVLGGLVVVARELGVSRRRGANVLVDSSVPLGKGVSSSAAIEVATIQALTAALGTAIDRYDLAVLGQTVENQIVGAPCGLMDQLTSTLGQANHLLCLRCQGRSVPSFIALPPDLHFVGIDSGVRHAITGASYYDVRVAAFMGYRIIAAHLGLKAEPAGDAHVRIDDVLYGGYLTNIAPSVFRTRYMDRLPETMSGAEFLDRYGGTTDPVTRVDPVRRYMVRAATAHPVEEEHRVRLFLEILRAEPTEQRLALLGEQMYQSHESYSRCGLGSEATDALVEVVRRAGWACGLYGAKITGGGSGGTVAVLAYGENGLAAVEAIAEEYGRGIRPHVFRGSSHGAFAVGVVTAECGR